MSKTISELTALTTVAADDYLIILDTSAGVTKKITVADLLNTLAAKASVVAGDSFLISDSEDSDDPKLVTAANVKTYMTS